MRRRGLALATALATASALFMFVAPAPSAQAVSGTDFDPGYIISDDLFYDGAAMSSAQIQSFLDSKIGTCQTGRCLNVAVVPVASRAASYSSTTGNLICSAISGGNLKVSELIYRTQVACGVSAKVLLVTLQKEQGLVTSSAPGDWALRAAMGMGCPDTGACDDAFAGLAAQIVAGARQLKVYKAAAFARQPGVNYITYNPNSDCGGTNLNIRNYATAALYNYTPYQPNAAALANLGGAGDSCSSYGNRNFWVYYNQWFGPTTEILCVANPSRDITRYWQEAGGANGVLGAAVSPGIVSGPASSYIGSYANGKVYCTPRLGAGAVLGDLQVKYDALGGPASQIGSPVGARTAFSAGGVSGFLQNFQRGTMLSSAATGTFAVSNGAMRDAWGSRGGSGGTLGWPVGDQVVVTNGVRQQFQRGVIMIPTGKPALVLTGAIATYWSSGATSISLGSPTGAASAFAAGGVSGELQYFERGLVLSSTATGTFAVLDGPVRTAWGNQGGSGGVLGWPTGSAEASSNGFRQAFQRGTVFASSSGAGAVMSAEIATYWTMGSNSAKLGYPTGSPSNWTASGLSGELQYFENGMVLSSSMTGTYAVLNGVIRNAWGAQGGSGGSFGWPTGDQLTDSGGVHQTFQGGTLTISGSSGSTGEIATYLAIGSNASRLGAPASAVTAWTAGGVTGQLQYFQRGMVLSSPSTGTYAVLDGPIRDAWGAQGGSGGTLGWPVADQQAASSSVRQEFQNGLITTGGSGAAVSGDIGTYWGAGSNATSLGAASTVAVPWTANGVTGQLQYFQRGMILSSSTTGTYGVLDGAIRDAWGARGGSSGSLGWPTGDQQTVSGGIRQQFQGGAITVLTRGSSVVLSGEIATYWNSGSNASLLGSATGSASAWAAAGVSGMLQYFERGMVLSSTTTGTYAVLDGPMRDAWSVAGGSGGTMGWPTGSQDVAPDGIRQQFQRGTLTVASSGVVIALSGEYYQYWSAGSNGVLLGAPKAPRVEWSAGGVVGSYQVFEAGMVLTSPTTGTYAVLDGPIRNAWGNDGGSGGSIGWPTGDQQPVAEGTRQQFQRGAIFVPPTGPAYIVRD